MAFWEVALRRGITCLRKLTETRISFRIGLSDGFAYLLQSVELALKLRKCAASEGQI